MTHKPEGVRIVLTDGTVIPVELIAGDDEDGLAVWLAPVGVDLRRVRQVLADRLPARTSVKLLAHRHTQGGPPR